MMVLVERDGTSLRFSIAAASSSGVISRGKPESERVRGRSPVSPFFL